MRIRLLGTAAGGGFPQWNCNCVNCHGARAGTLSARPRSQSCVAVSADGRRWFLLNASPDVRLQIESFAPLLPRGTMRGTGVEGVLLSNADLDHTLGLLVLREGERLVVHAPPGVQLALTEGLSLTSVMASYCGIDWREPPADLAPLGCADGSPSGLHYAVFSVPGEPPRYWQGGGETSAAFNVGYRLVDHATGGRLVFMPDVADLNETVLAHLDDCDALLLDGTFWSQNEMQTMGTGRLSAADMDHQPVGGPAGSLARIGPLPIQRKIYMHINNTNPMLREDSPERLAVEAVGVQIGWDGYEFVL